MNVEMVNDYIYKNTKILPNESFSFRIDTICDSSLQGYLVSFDAIDAAIDNNDDYKCKIGDTYIDNIHHFINSNSYLKNLNVFNILDLYLGDVDYMQFTIK